MSDEIKKLQTEIETINQKLIDSSNLSPDEIKSLSRQKSKLEKLLDIKNKIVQIIKRIKENKTLLDNPDEQISNLAKEEVETDEAAKKLLEQQLASLLNPSIEDKDVIMEIRAGTGGDEAAMFAGDLFRMYSRYAENKGWETTLLSSNQLESSEGYKEIIFQIEGDGVWASLRFEMGVHRVQRTPTTETRGRVHTSTATVAVMPIAETVDIDIKPEDLRIDVFHSSGKGGQSVNTTDSAVRITHLPTGTVSSCQTERSQTQNKEKAMAVLRTRILDAQQETFATQRKKDRRKQVGTGDRSEKIRTYNFPQDRITDHRIKKNWHNIDKILSGQLDPIIKDLNEAQKDIESSNQDIA